MESVPRRGASEVACGRRFAAPDPGIVRLDGDFPARAMAAGPVVAGVVEVTSNGDVAGVAAAAADVFLVRAGRVVTLPLPQDAMGVRWDLAAGDTARLPATGSLQSCRPDAGPLAPGDHDLYVRVILVPDTTSTPHAVFGGPWSLEVT